MKNPLFNFKNPQEAGPSAVLLAALLILAGSLAVVLLVPTPTVVGKEKDKAATRKQIQDQIEATQMKGQQARAQAANRLWQGDPDTITAAVLARLTQEANGRKLKLSAFRPQRIQNLPELSELPFSVQVSGAYPSVHAFAATLDALGSKLALRSLQLASSDANSNAVTATLGISAFIPALPSTSPTPTKGGATRG